MKMVVFGGKQVNKKEEEMRFRWLVRTAFLVTLAIATGTALVHAAPKSKKGGKGKGGGGGGNTQPLMRAVFDNTSGMAIRGDGTGESSEYVDGRVLSGGDADVQAFLFPSGNFGLRLEGSERFLVIDFSGGPISGSCGSDPCTPLPADFLPTLDVHIRELNNNGLIECGSGNGLLCVTTMNNYVESRFVVNWDFEGRRYRVRLRPDLDLGTDALIITRIEGNLPTWTFEPSSGDALLRVTSDKIKGKSKPQDHGLFTMPFKITISCVDEECK